MNKMPTELKKTEITLKMLVESELLSAGEELLCEHPNARGILNSDGSIKVILEGNEKAFQYPSGAARYVENKSLNGWKYWFIRINDEVHFLDSFREKFHSEHRFRSSNFSH